MTTPLDGRADDSKLSKKELNADMSKISQLDVVVERADPFTSGSFPNSDGGENVAPPDVRSDLVSDGGAAALTVGGEPADALSAHGYEVLS